MLNLDHHSRIIDPETKAPGFKDPFLRRTAGAVMGFSPRGVIFGAAM
jgi:hypothetical protein